MTTIQTTMQRLDTIESYLTNHVATRAEVAELRDAMDKRFDGLEQDVKDLKTDLQEVLSLLR